MVKIERENRKNVRNVCKWCVSVCMFFFRSLLNWLISQILLRAEQYLVIIEFRKCLYLWKLFAKQNSYHWIIKDKETSLLTLINLLLVWKIYSIAVEFTHQTAGNLGHSTSIEKKTTATKAYSTQHTHTHTYAVYGVCVCWDFGFPFNLDFFSSLHYQQTIRHPISLNHLPLCIVTSSMRIN